MKGSAWLPAGIGPALGADGGDAMRTSLCSIFKAYAVVHYATSHVKAYFARATVVRHSGNSTPWDVSASCYKVSLDRTLLKLWELYSTFVRLVNMNAA